MNCRRSTLFLALPIALNMAFLAPAFGQKVPDAFEQEVLIKSALMTLNDADLTGNYAVMHAKVAAPFRDSANIDKFKVAFKDFADGHTDIKSIVAKPPVPSSPAKVDDEGNLKLIGYFDTVPRQVHYDLSFIRSEGEWKLMGIHVNVKNDAPKTDK